MRVVEIKQKLKELGVVGYSRLLKAELEVLLETELEKRFPTEEHTIWKLEASSNLCEPETLEFSNNNNNNLPFHTFYEWVRTKKKFKRFRLFKNGRLINMRITNPH